MNKPSKEEMITEICNQMDGWDINEICRWARETRSNLLDELNEDEITNIYLQECVNDEIPDWSTNEN